MQIQHNVSLKNYSTMRLGGMANALTTVKSKQDLLDALAWADQNSLPILVLGGGSNIIFSDGYSGLVIINRISGFKVSEDNSKSTVVSVGAGENWDEIVEKTVKMELHGIEFLSAIPGTVGATPVQNVGAYGAEIADTFVELEAYDLQTSQFVTLSKADCKFSYRNSIFKSTQNRRYIITSVIMRLTKEAPKPPFYASLQRHLDQNEVTDFTVQSIRKAVVAIRAHNLPDPSKIPNTGSFFKNPIIPANKAAEIIKKFPDIPNWAMPEGRVKLAAGWLVDKAGLKGYSAHGMRTYQNNALVLVNDAANSFADLAAFKDEIVQKVYGIFGVKLEQEPELL